MTNDSMDVQRRRKGSGPVGRAEAPRRDTGGSRPPSGASPIGAGPIGGCGIVVILLVIVAYFLLTGGAGLNLGGSGAPDAGPGLPGLSPAEPGAAGSGSSVQPTPPATNFTPPVPAASSNQTWTVMLYQDADDQVLEQDVYLDLNEAERVGSSKSVNIVAQLDRFRSGFRGDGDWTSARRYYVTQDNDLRQIRSQMIQDLGEVDMSASQTLVDFVQWAAQSYPADRYVLILSDHGMGWPGGWSDPDPGGQDESGVPIASLLGKNLYLMQLDSALGQARAQAGIDKFEIVGMDACLMSQLEIMAALQPHANYAVASEEVEPAIGWAYTAFLGELVKAPDMSGADLSRLMVQSYISSDQRVLDPAARADFMRGGSPIGGFFAGSTASAEQLSAQLNRDATMSAIDLNAVPELMQVFNAFAYQLQNEDQPRVAQARRYAQSYTSLFGREVPPSYIDLGHFVQLMQATTSDDRTKQAADGVIASLRKAIVAEKHGAGRKGSMGLALYFPNSTLYSSRVAGPESYTAVANRFAAESLWDDFMAFHYMDRNFDPNVAEPYLPAASDVTRAPGSGQITLSEIRVSSSEAAPDQPLTLSVDVSGNNIGYIKLLVGYYDASANSLNISDTDYLEAADTRQVAGVFYPAWPDGGFTMNYEWDVTVFAISDGSQNAVALFEPVQYGASAEDAEYTVDGIYTFAETGERRYAQLLFQNEKLIQVVGFTGETDTGAPREITPAQGDTFTIYEKWMDLDANGQVTGIAKEEGVTLTFGSEPFKWVQLYAAAGDYVIGFIAEDLDGNQYPAYTSITVK